MGEPEGGRRKGGEGQKIQYLVSYGLEVNLNGNEGGEKRGEEVIFSSERSGGGRANCLLAQKCS